MKALPSSFRALLPAIAFGIVPTAAASGPSVIQAQGTLTMTGASSNSSIVAVQATGTLIMTGAGAQARDSPTVGVQASDTLRMTGVSSNSSITAVQATGTLIMTGASYGRHASSIRGRSKIRVHARSAPGGRIGRSRTAPTPGR
jgi:hypothetical protein